MILVDFFGCKREQVLACNWEEACDRFPFVGMTFPDVSGLISLSEALTGSNVSAAAPVPLSTEPLLELGDQLQAVVRQASAEELMDAGARWAQLQPWKQLDTNPMDLAGFLLHLQSLVTGPERTGNLIFLWVEGKVPFPVVDWRNDPHWMVKSFFNYVCEQHTLVDALDYITQRCGYAYNEEYCAFPDRDDPDSSLHFGGVAFGVCDEEVVITEVECWQYVRHASLFWTKHNKTDADEVGQMLSRIPN